MGTTPGRHAPLVQTFLEDSADKLTDKVALVCDGQRLTYGEIESRANRLAHGLRSLGVQRGDRVVIHLPNSVDLVIAVFAALKAGGTFVPINHTTKYDKLTYVLNDCQATILITSAEHAAWCSQLASAVPGLKAVILSTFGSPASIAGLDALTLDDLVSRQEGRRPAPVNIDLDLACLIYTSGTTGNPKGVMSDHSNMVFAASAIIEYLENVESDVVIDALPLAFDYGLYQLLMTFKFGGTLVLERGFVYPAAFLKRMEEERVTGFPGIPTIFSILLRTDLSAYDLAAIRYVTNTAAALPVSHITQLRGLFPQAKLYSMYGLTETKRTLYLPPAQLDKRPGSVGIAIPGTEVWIEDEAGRRLGPGETGELVIRGRHVMRGYWNDPAASAARFRPGPLPNERVCYSGDLFRMDDEGYMYFVARKDDIIKTCGEKVAPREVENVLCSLEGVAEAAVVGTPDPVMGQSIVAFVVLGKPGLTEKDILVHCRAHLENYMVPKRVEIRADLPKTPSGKIKKTDLKIGE